ncbi:hypothetical protein [Psychrobium sp. 1_MG-2023]|uniref:hypothetical protein n=1 Tax=Psychrobium sp. 1_MG-2023 TaxID=3062624 RepID=UPI000C332AF9|nr:hypothetical protein [Psychrobium sp. 1_MG-2023]MDP2561190.1 hypothetical protein [Psychrobium sp. 1_MG-2023]PKF55305.1 hypothetical protein CW748_13900 [Alteromonadales bacterium alter-6D02]
MKQYVSALDLIELSNDVGNAIVHSEHAINSLQLNTNNYNFEKVWQELLDIQFWGYDVTYQQAAKAVCEQLIQSACLVNEQQLMIDDEFIDECLDDIEQLKFDF